MEFWRWAVPLRGIHYGTTGCAFRFGCFVGFAYLTSVNRHAIRWQPILWGLALQIIFALFILRTVVGFTIFQWLGNAVGSFLNYSDAGASFVFGENFQDFFFAFKVLPTVIFFSAFISLLYHYGTLQKAVRAIAWIMMRTMENLRLRNTLGSRQYLRRPNRSTAVD